MLKIMAVKAGSDLGPKINSKTQPFNRAIASLLILSVLLGCSSNTIRRRYLLDPAEEEKRQHLIDVARNHDLKVYTDQGDIIQAKDLSMSSDSLWFRRHGEIGLFKDAVYQPHALSYSANSVNRISVLQSDRAVQKSLVGGLVGLGVSILGYFILDASIPSETGSDASPSFLAVVPGTLLGSTTGYYIGKNQKIWDEYHFDNPSNG